MRDVPIRIMGEEAPIDLLYDQAAAYHGQAALAMLAIMFQGLRGALTMLAPGQDLKRNELSVVCGHPGPGVRDAFEFVTRAATRGVYDVDRTLPLARLNPMANISYSFRLMHGNRTVVAALRPGVLPARFFELLNMPAEQRSPDWKGEISALKRRIADHALRQKPDDLFEMSLQAANVEAA